jgi:glycosyl transferase family 25
VIPVYIVHAAFLTERRAAMQAQLARHGLAAEWITAYDAEDIGPELKGRWFAPELPMHAGQMSCALKHVEALRRIAASGADRALVLEDDVVLCEGFPVRLAAVLAEADTRPRPHTLQIGVASNRYTPGSRLKAGQLLYEAERTRNGEAYVLGAQEARMRLGWIEAHRMPLPIDLTFDRCDPALGIAILWAEPPLAEQGSITGLYPSTLETKRRSRLRLRVQFAVRKWTRRYLYRWLGVR